MISHVHKVIFVHIPRTAGTSIEVALVGKDWWSIDQDTKHISASKARLEYEQFWEAYTTFTVIRDEEARIDSFCEKFEVPKESVRSSGSFLNAPLDVYLSYSNLTNEWAKFAERIGKGAPKDLPHVGKS